MTKSLIIIALLFTTRLLGAVTNDSINTWPKEISSGDYTIVIYAPENETYLDHKLNSKSAFSVQSPSLESPVFGIMWTTSLLDVDRTSRMATLVSIQVDEVKFPNEVSEQQKEEFKKMIAESIPKWDMEFSIDELIKSLEEVSVYQNNLSADVPKIIFSEEPAALIIIDGDPKFKKVDKSYSMIQNSSTFIALEESTGLYYLKGGEFWYQAISTDGPWESTKEVSSSLKKLAEKSKDDNENEPDEDKYTGERPNIIISTEPCELIITDGKASYKPLQNTNLLYVSNTESDLFMYVKNQTYYILISGRWFTTENLSKGWVYTKSTDLPVDFTKINPEGDKSHVLSSIAGTKEAKEAVYDAQIPQTAEVSRSTKATEVIYNGDPEFNKIEGLELAYALNTESTVFKDKDIYYLCDNAIWFVSNSPNGPWKVADNRPSEVENIPATNPKYNTKYVYIYETTPTVVYVGYTPGYYGSYVYHNTVVYGTGFNYYPWYNGHYYHHHYSYGYSIRYSPWYGWSISFGYGTPHYWWGYSYGGHGHYHWGPPHYRPPYYRNRNHYRPHVPTYRRPGVKKYTKPGAHRPPSRPNTPSSRPVTKPNKPTKRPVVQPSKPVQKPVTRPSQPIHKPTAKPSRPAYKPITRPPSMNRPSTRPAARPSTRPTARPSSRPSSAKGRR